MGARSSWNGRGPLETYLPDAIGDGGTHTLYVTQASGMTSLLKPDPHQLGQFNGFREWGAVIEEIPVTTRRLDDIGSLDPFDLLKIDIQGGELMVFQGGPPPPRPCRRRADGDLLRPPVREPADLRRYRPRTARPGFHSALLPRDQALGHRASGLRRRLSTRQATSYWRQTSSTSATSPAPMR